MRKDIGRYIFKRPRAGARAAQAALRREEAVPAHQLALGLHRRGDALPARRRAARVPDLAELLRHRGDRRAASPPSSPSSEPFLELDPAPGRHGAPARPTRSSAARSTRAATCSTFERLTGCAGEQVLYVGDHIYGDILRKSKKASLWRTCMVVQEMEDEINYTERPRRRRAPADRGGAAARAARRRDQRPQGCSSTRSIARLERGGPLRRTRSGERAGSARSPSWTGCAGALQGHDRRGCRAGARVEHGFNPYWGLLFKEGNENTRFGEQVEQYACLYTSRVSNFLYYSPMQYFRSPARPCRTSAPLCAAVEYGTGKRRRTWRRVPLRGHHARDEPPPPAACIARYPCVRARTRPGAVAAGAHPRVALGRARPPLAGDRALAAAASRRRRT